MDAPLVPKYCTLPGACRCRVPAVAAFVRLYRVSRTAANDWRVYPSISMRGGRRVRPVFRTSNKASAWRFVAHLMKRVGGSNAQR
jgi:hypothetical protein